MEAKGRSWKLKDAHFWIDAHGRWSDAGRSLVGRSWTIKDVRKIWSRDGHGHASES